MTEIKSESEMLSFAENFAQNFLRHSPKPSSDSQNSTTAQPAAYSSKISPDDQGSATTQPAAFVLELILPDPGLMRDELAKTLNDPHNLVVVEWADSVHDLLPPSRQTIKFSYSEIPNSSEISNSTEPSEGLNPSESSARTLEFIPPLDSESPEAA